jgi:hypothetical protein
VNLLSCASEITDLQHMIAWYEGRLARAKRNGSYLTVMYEAILETKRKKLVELQRNESPRGQEIAP